MALPAGTFEVPSQPSEGVKAMAPTRASLSFPFSFLLFLKLRLPHFLSLFFLWVLLFIGSLSLFFHLAHFVRRCAIVMARYEPVGERAMSHSIV